MDDSVTLVARAAGVLPSHLARELARAIRRSEPDAREVYGVINGRRFVARRAASSIRWVVSLERRPQPWERAYGTGWTA